MGRNGRTQRHSLDRALCPTRRRRPHRPHGLGSQRNSVHFAQPSTEDLEAYLATGEPLQVAGAFTLDSLGGWFVERIEGDPSSVIGIGLPLVRTLLERVGVSVSDLWRTQSIF